MDTADLNSPRSQEYELDGSPAPGTSEKTKDGLDPLKLTKKGVENAKKKLRAFSIQKKPTLSPIPQPKPLSCGSSTVFIGKFTSSKPPLKPGGIEEVPDSKKPPKPPKPGATKLHNADYINLQKKTLSEIEDMKRKMELVELGIPLGLICPTPDSDKAMPTKAMPPIKSLLARNIRIYHPLKTEGNARLKRGKGNAIPKNPAKVDEIIREAKKAKAEGKSFKFSYQKQLPSYENPFKKKDKEPLPLIEDPRLRDRRRFAEAKRYSAHKDRSKDRDYHRDEKYRGKRSDRSKYSRKEKRNKERDVKSKDPKKDKHDTINLSDDDDIQEVLDEVVEKEEKETDENLKGFVVCDSWSENEEKNKETSPKSENKTTKEEEIDKKENKEDLTPTPVLDPVEQLKQTLLKNADVPKEPIEKLKPVTDSFKFEIEDDDDEVLDMFSENIALNKFAKQIPKKNIRSPIRFDYESKDTSMDVMDDTFLESVIAEIKQENIDDDDDNDTNQDKGLVEYDFSPKEDERVTPELDDRVKELYSSRSDYSDGFKSVESLKSTESGYKSTESGYKPYSTYKPIDHKSIEGVYKTTECGYTSPEASSPMEAPHMEAEFKMAKTTVESLETWSFVLKICQPLLFRHDKKRCYKETRGNPKLWYAENPKVCACVKDRSVVYEELEMCKMELVDRVYGSGQVQEAIYPEARGWYPANFSLESAPPTVCSEWEADDSQERPTPPHAMALNREYQKFMEAVWPDVEANKSETPRSTPVREAVKKKAEDEPDIKKKKMKLSSEGWSQESEVDEEIEKTKKRKVDKIKRKRKHSTSLSDSDDETPSKKKKAQKKDKQKSKSKTTKRRLSKKFLKKLKDKQLKKKKKLARMEESQDREKEKKKRDKKLKKKKLLKQKKKTPKKKKPKARSSSSSDSEPERSKKSDKKKKRKRKKSTSDSNQSEELFDVNILKNIKTERLTDDEKSKISPVKKHREIIDVKELQNDFVNIQIKKEIEDVNSPETFEEIDSYTEEEMRVIAQIEDRKIELKECERKEVERIEADTGIETADTEMKRFEVAEQGYKRPEPEPEYIQPLTPQIKLPDENLSQCSSQESTSSAKEQPYEKDDSHLRPSSQNSNYTFHDVMQSSGHEMQMQREHYAKDIQMTTPTQYAKDIQNLPTQSQLYAKDIELPTQSQYYAKDIELPPQNQYYAKDLELPTQSQYYTKDIELPTQSQFYAKDIELPKESQDYKNIELPAQSQPYAKEIQIHTSQSGFAKDIQIAMPAQSQRYTKDIQADMPAPDLYSKDIQMVITPEYEQGNYEMYEQMAMEYQSDVASQRAAPPESVPSGRIETVVRTHSRGEIKCDWRAGDPTGGPARPSPRRDPSQAPRVSRWGLKPCDVNIVLTGGNETEQKQERTVQFPAPTPTPAAAAAPPAAVYQIQSIANRTENSNSGYDEAYMDMYGASDRLQYGDCFARESANKAVDTAPPAPAPPAPTLSSLDKRIDLALRTTVLGEVAKADTEINVGPDKGILVTKSLAESRGAKRVSFADGYKPGQDSDTEEPPVKKKKKARRVGCPWPCPASHPDHVSLWDALPPPPPPPGSPPPRRAPAPPPLALLRQQRHQPSMLPQPPHSMPKFDPTALAAFMPPEPPPGLISF